MLPEARQDKLLVQEVEDELVVYDQERDRAHLLNRTVALVWRNCDGRQTVADIAALLRNALNFPAAEEALVWLALSRLERAHLLQERRQRPADAPGISRRQAMRQLSLAGGFMALVPTITSIVIPAPAMAASACVAFAGEKVDCPPCLGTRCITDSGDLILGSCAVLFNGCACHFPTKTCVLS